MHMFPKPQSRKVTRIHNAELTSNLNILAVLFPAAEWGLSARLPPF